MDELRAGFLPLLDAAILIAAKERGFAEAHGISLKLFRETSWANIRDRVSVGQFDVAHMLAPMPVAQNLGLSPLHVPLVAPFAMGLGGNAITVSREVYSKMCDHDEVGSGDPLRAGIALRQVIASRREAGKPSLVFAVVHNFSGHAYELRYWLAACGINPDIDIQITIVPPPLMSDALASGAIDGFCVGEPWNSQTVALGQGEVVTTKSLIWRSSPEKVLGMRRRWSEDNPELLRRLLLALHESAVWCGAPENVDELAALLSAKHYLGVSSEVVRQGLTGDVLRSRMCDDFINFVGGAANFPWQSHALWFLSQMVRWNQVQLSPAAVEIARTSYRPDLYRQALGGHGVALPGASSKVEGALKEPTFIPASGGKLALGPDGFFDGIVFDPADIESYLLTLARLGALHNDSAA